MKKYLISGMPPGYSGTGRLLDALIPNAKKDGFKVIMPVLTPPLSLLVKNRDIKGLRKKIIYNKITRKIIFHIQTAHIKNAIILFLHPQSAGFKRFLSLIKSNEMYYYVLDNSFFCARSYNNNPITEKECFICLKNPEKILPECMPCPVRYEKQKYINYLKKLKKYADRLVFFAQNENQKKLLIKSRAHNLCRKSFSMIQTKVL